MFITIVTNVYHYCPPNLMDRFEEGREVDGEWRRNFRIGAFAQTPAVRIENMSAVRVREEFKRYFLNEGQVSCQQRRVDEGSF